MPSRGHLIELKSVIQQVIVPIGQSSEESQEKRNKDYMLFREHHSRQNSRVNTDTDFFDFLLVTFDSKITALRAKAKKSTNKLPPEVIYLLNVEKYQYQVMNPNLALTKINLYAIHVNS